MSHQHKRNAVMRLERCFSARSAANLATRFPASVALESALREAKMGSLTDKKPNVRSPLSHETPDGPVRSLLNGHASRGIAARRVGT